mmetsp:Transcript_30702/g.60427  ORF Transcript_30702/g.60427 Transcript_30702/m.60427 type:complete len:94 (-) Transcript_30702:283-564(-)
MHIHTINRFVLFSHPLRLTLGLFSLFAFDQTIRSFSPLPPCFHLLFDALNVPKEWACAYVTVCLLACVGGRKGRACALEGGGEASLRGESQKD